MRRELINHEVNWPNAKWWGSKQGYPISVQLEWNVQLPMMFWSAPSEKKPSSVKFSLYNFPSLMSLMYPSSRVDAFWFQMCFTKLPSKNLIKKSVQFNSSTFTFTAMKTGSWKLISIWELTEKYEEF